MTFSLQAFADSLADTFPCCDDAPLALGLIDQLAEGEPVTVARLAQAVDRDEPDVAAVPDRWPTVHRDDQGRIVAFAGLSLTPTQHGFDVAGSPLYAWCAWDALFLPGLIGQEARVKSTCPVTGREVRLTVRPAGVHNAEPGSLLVSFPAPASTVISDITGSFCRHVRFLAGREAAEVWLADDQGGLVLSLDDAVELGRLATRPLLEDGDPQVGGGRYDHPRC